MLKNYGNFSLWFAFLSKAYLNFINQIWPKRRPRFSHIPFGRLRTYTHTHTHNYVREFVCETAPLCMVVPNLILDSIVKKRVLFRVNISFYLSHCLSHLCGRAVHVCVCVCVLEYILCILHDKTRMCSVALSRMPREKWIIVFAPKWETTRRKRREKEEEIFALAAISITET